MDLSQIPAVQPPEGVTLNFVDPPSLATLYRVTIYIFMPLMSALVVLRLGTRFRQMHKLVADDRTYITVFPEFSRCTQLLKLDGNNSLLHPWGCEQHTRYSTMLTLKLIISLDFHHLVLRHCFSW